MDADRFEALLRSLSQSPSRRGALRLLAGSALGGGLAPLLGLPETDAHNALKKCKKINDKAKRKKCVKKAKKHNTQHALESPPAGCPEGQRPCRETCIGTGQCCSGADCPSGVCSSEGRCLGAGCGDFIRNGDETDLDCGGSCPGCAAGKSCIINDDCQSDICCDGVCVAECCGQLFRAECPTGEVCQDQTCETCAAETAAANNCDRAPGRICGEYESGSGTVLCFCITTKSGAVVCTDQSICRTCVDDDECDGDDVCADAPGCCGAFQTVCLRPGCPGT